MIATEFVVHSPLKTYALALAHLNIWDDFVRHILFGQWPLNIILHFFEILCLRLYFVKQISQIQ
jgi:hypothetical protein